MADNDRVIIRHKQTLEERDIARAALPFFVKEDGDFEVLDSKGRVSGSATAAAKEK